MPIKHSRKPSFLEEVIENKKKNDYFSEKANKEYKETRTTQESNNLINN